MPNCSLDNAIEVLNRINEQDPTVLPELFAYRVPCNVGVANDPTVQVGFVNDDIESNQYEVGLLGILNGLFGLDSQGWGYIVAVMDDNSMRIKEFRKSYA